MVVWFYISVAALIIQWAESLERFTSGERPDSIAVTQSSGKAVQTATIVGHLLTALEHGRPVDIGRLASTAGASQVEAGVPNSDEWEALEEAEAAAQVDVTATGRVEMPAILKELRFPDVASAAEVAFADRTEAQKLAMSAWYSRIKWWQSFKRAGFVPQFGQGAGVGQKHGQTSGANPDAKRRCSGGGGM